MEVKKGALGTVGPEFAFVKDIATSQLFVETRSSPKGSWIAGCVFLKILQTENCADLSQAMNKHGEQLLAQTILQQKAIQRQLDELAQRLQQHTNQAHRVS